MVYVKGMSDYIAPILIIIFSFFIYKNSLKTTFKHIALYFFIYCLILSPWWIHNWNKYNEFVRTDLAYGYHIYSGNNIMNESGGGIGGVDVDHSKIFESNQNDFVKSDKVFKQEAYKYILEDPIRFLKQSIRKFYSFLSFSPYTKEYKGLIYSIVSFISFVINIYYIKLNVKVKKLEFVSFRSFVMTVNLICDSKKRISLIYIFSKDTLPRIFVE